MILEVLLASLFVFVLLLIALLIVPFHLRLQLSRTGGLLGAEVGISWIGLTFFRRKILGEEEKKKPPATEKKEYRKKRGARSRSELILRLRESLPYLPRLLKTFLRSVFLERFCCDVTIGLGDPAYTAIANGILWVIASAMNVFPRTYLSVNTDFLTDRLDASVAAELRVRLMWIALAGISALTIRPVRQFLLGMRG